MGFNPATGQTLEGKQLPTLPPNASNEEQTVIINDIIGVLNNFSRDVVASGSQIVSLAAGNQSDILTIPHNLGYSPMPYVYVPGVTLIDSAGVRHVGVDIPLPTYLSSGDDGTHIVFFSWLDYFVDATNLYIQLRLGSAIGADINLRINYFLTRRPAN